MDNRTYATVYIIQPLTPMTPYAPFILNSLNICIYAYIPSLMTPFGPLCDLILTVQMCYHSTTYPYDPI